MYHKNVRYFSLLLNNFQLHHHYWLSLNYEGIFILTSLVTVTNIQNLLNYWRFHSRISQLLFTYLLQQVELAYNYSLFTLKSLSTWNSPYMIFSDSQQYSCLQELKSPPQKKSVVLSWQNLKRHRRSRGFTDLYRPLSHRKPHWQTHYT